MAAIITLFSSPKLDHHFFLVLLLLLTPFATPLTFNFPTVHQRDPANITRLLITEGGAVIGDQFIMLTINGSVGRAKYSEPFLLRENATGKLADFSTSFTFIIESRNSTSPSYSEGLAFFIAPNGSLLNHALGVGSSIGLPVNSSVGNVIEPSNEYPFVAVEFDTNPNPWPAVEDPESGHVGIDVNSVHSNVTKPWSGGIVKAKLNQAWISYDSNSKNLSVAFTTYANGSQEQMISALSYMVDLNKYLPDQVIVGFSASTGAASAKHNIISWNFTSTSRVDDESVAVSGQEKKQESRVPPPGRSPKVKSRKRKKSLVVVIGSSIGGGGGFILVCVVGLGLFNSCKKKITRERTDENLMIPHDLIDKFKKEMDRPRQFSYTQLASATGNFAEGEKLREEELGVVYKGYLKDLNSYVAVKKITTGSGFELRDVVSEVRIITRLRHRNLMQLIGWCHEKGQLLLVYEFMPNGNLSSHLFEGESSLVLEVRYKITQGLASGLLYLQQGVEQCVLHRDIKSRNVMLDSDFNPKLGGFWLSRLAHHREQLEMTNVAGTFGYIDPEYLRTGEACKVSDVYSFGVVVLEIACGRRAIDHNTERVLLVEWVWKLYSEGKVIEAADPKLCGDFDEKQMECLLIVGLWCTHPEYNLRSSIQQALQALNIEIPLPILLSNIPMSTSALPISRSGSSSTAISSLSSLRFSP